MYWSTNRDSLELTFTLKTDQFVCELSSTYPHRQLGLEIRTHIKLHSLNQSHTHAFTPHLASPHTHRVPEKKPDTQCAHQHNLHGHWYTLTAVSFLLCPPQNTHTNTHTHLQEDTWLYPLTCNFRHRCAGWPHTHTRSHTDIHYKIGDREHMRSHGIMTLTLMCTPELHCTDDTQARCGLHRCNARSLLQITLVEERLPRK